MRVLVGLRPWLLAPCLLVLGIGCESRVSLGAVCQRDDACQAPLRCRYGRCRAECDSASDCVAGALCVGAPGVCTTVTDTCAAGCPEGFFCTGTLCAFECAAATDCRGGAVCEGFEGHDVCVAAGLSDAGMDASIVADDAHVVPDAGMDAPVADDATEGIDAGADATESSDAVTSTDASVSVPQLEAHRRLAAGSAQACVIRGGRVYCWGSNHAGELGDSPSSTPIPHDGLCPPWECSDRPESPILRASSGTATPLEGAISIASGIQTTCALVEGGSVWCWGGYGNALGHSGTAAHAGFAIASGASSLAVGRQHACARVGTPGATEIRCWGNNEFSFSVDGGLVSGDDGRLGSLGGSTLTPRVATAFSDATALSLGGLFTCRAGAEGVRCVGFNEADVTGLGVYGHDPVGRVVAGLPGAIDDLSALVATACAVSGGDVYCWGAQLDHLLGTSTVPRCFEPSVTSFCRADAQAVEREFDVLGLRFVALSRGQADTMCAITDTRRVVCWGWNSHGQAGVPATVGSDVVRPTSFVQTAPDVPLEDVVEVACGVAFCCALRTDESVWCWGENDFGQLGTGTSDSRDVDAAIPDGGSTVALPHPYAQPVDFSAVTP